MKGSVEYLAFLRGGYWLLLEEHAIEAALVLLLHFHFLLPRTHIHLHLRGLIVCPRGNAWGERCMEGEWGGVEQRLLLVRGLVPSMVVVVVVVAGAREQPLLALLLVMRAGVRVRLRLRLSLSPLHMLWTC